MRRSIITTLLLLFACLCRQAAPAAASELDRTERTLIHRSRGIFSTTEIVVVYNDLGIVRVSKNGRGVAPEDFDKYYRYLEHAEFARDIVAAELDLSTIDDQLRMLRQSENASVAELLQLEDKLVALEARLMPHAKKRPELLRHLRESVEMELFRQLLSRALIADGLIADPREIDIRFEKQWMYVNDQRHPGAVADKYRSLFARFHDGTVTSYLRTEDDG